MARQRLVIVGNGMAGLRFLEEILEHARGHFDITVVGAEPVAAYNRVLLSAVLAGEAATADVLLRPVQWYAEHKIELITGQVAEVLDSRARFVGLQNGRTIPFDILVLATGSDPMTLAVPGCSLKGVATFRSLNDITTFERFAGARLGRGFQHVTGISFPMSKGRNLGKIACSRANSQPEVENCPILTLRLRVRREGARSGRRVRLDRPDATRCDQGRNPEVEVGGTGGRGLPQHPRGGRPLAPRVGR